MSRIQEIGPDFYHALFHNSRVNAFIHMDTTGIIREVNPAFKNFFGYNDEDVAGKHFSILFTETDRNEQKPEKEIANALKNKQADDKNFMVHKDRKISWVSGESILIEHSNGERSLLKMIQDIQVQKESELNLSRANDFNESILNSINDFVIILDKSMQVLKYNPAFSRLFRNSEFLPVTDFPAFIRPFDKTDELVTKISTVIKTGEPIDKHAVGIFTDSGEKIFDISCQSIFTKDLENVVLLIGHDITEQRRTEKEREDLMGFVAHELRNPLTSIRMSNDIMTMMVNEHKTTELQDWLEKNKKYIDRLNKMIAELYDAAKLGGGNFLLTPVLFDFDELVTETIESFRVLNPLFQFNMQGTTGSKILGDRERINQVLSNYLSNAVKYSGADSHITVTAIMENKMITVAVQDRGPGVAAEQLNLIFDRYFRADKTKHLEGLGLGLYLCRRIIVAHGGKVWAESSEGKGSIFYFSLPAAKN